MMHSAGSDSNSAYYLHRAADERQAAETAIHQKARNIHLRLALFYEAAAHAEVEETSQVLEAALQ